MVDRSLCGMSRTTDATVPGSARKRHRKSRGFTLCGRTAKGSATNSLLSIHPILRLWEFPRTGAGFGQHVGSDNVPDSHSARPFRATIPRDHSARRYRDGGEGRFVTRRSPLSTAPQKFGVQLLGARLRRGLLRRQLYFLVTKGRRAPPRSSLRSSLHSRRNSRVYLVQRRALPALAWTPTCGALY
jgi:hypothetical protein